ncbi:MAG: type II toxin-antitoxin system RelE/ParE family toxin [Patescibacteria group bacterium]
MIYTDSNEYKVKFFVDPKTGKDPVMKYINDLDEKQKAKVSRFIEFLRQHEGVLDEPYSKHIKGKIRELRIDFGKNRHRIFYFTFINKNIILLHAFLKHTQKTPETEIKIAENNYNIVINNPKFYE